MPAHAWTSAVAANALAFVAFVLSLYLNLLPGEPLDWAAVSFGLFVFAVYAAIDLKRPGRATHLEGS